MTHSLVVAHSVMAGLVPAIHAFTLRKDVDTRHKAGHDEELMSSRPERSGREPPHPWCHPRLSSPRRRGGGVTVEVQHG